MQEISQSIGGVWHFDIPSVDSLLTNGERSFKIDFLLFLTVFKNYS